MSCKHKFYKQLIPDCNNIEYIFVGTFNPGWTGPNDCDFFYGRPTNNFWCIMPHVFGDNCLIDKDSSEWIDYCYKKKIAITDLIKEVLNADENNEKHYDLIMKGYSDSNLEIKSESNNYLFEFDFNSENIITIIKNNSATLKGVFFTRKTGTDIPRLWKEWNSIKDFCYHKNIKAGELITPSTFGPGIKKSILDWKNVILYKA